MKHSNILINNKFLKEKGIKYKKTRMNSRTLHFVLDNKIFCGKRVTIPVIKIKNNHRFCNECKGKLQKIISENTLQFFNYTDEPSEHTVISPKLNKNTSFESSKNFENFTNLEKHEKPTNLKNFEKKSLEERKIFDKKMKENQTSSGFPFGEKRKLDPTDLMNEGKYKKRNISRNNVLSDLKKSILWGNNEKEIFSQEEITTIGNWNFESVHQIPLLVIGIPDQIMEFK